MNRGPLAAILAMALAGCLADDDSSSAAPLTTPPASQTTPATVVFANQTFELELTATSDSSQRALAGNCVRIPGGARILGGNLTATWTPQSPATEELLLAASSTEDRGERSVSASPLHLNLGGPWDDPGDDGHYRLWVSLAGPGAAVRQAVTLTVELQSTAPLEFFDGQGCVA